MFRQEKVFTEDQRSTFIDMIANKDGWGLKRMGQEVGNDVMSGLFSSFQKGEVSKTKAAVREYVGEANQELKDGLNYIGESITAENDGAIQEALAEMNNIELGFVIAGLSEIQKQQLTEMGVEI